MKLIECRKCGRYFRVTDNDYCLSKCTGCGSPDLEETIYKLDGNNIDWEQRRYEIARDILSTSHIAQQIGHYSYHEETEVKVAESIGGIEDIRIYGTDGSGVSQISSNVPVMIRQAMDVVSEATGVDMKDVLRASTIEAKTDRNVDVDVNGVVLPNKE